MSEIHRFANKLRHTLEVRLEIAIAEILKSLEETVRNTLSDRWIGASSYGRQRGSCSRHTRGKVCTAPGEGAQGIRVTALAMPHTGLVGRD